MVEKTADILAIGGNNIDLVLTVSHLPAHAEKETAQFIGRFPGGPAGNFAIASFNQPGFEQLPGSTLTLAAARQLLEYSPHTKEISE